MTRLILIRHGETDLSGRFCGQSDPDLNARGEEQVRELVRELKDVRIDSVYSSDLLRARRTAEAVARSAELRVHMVPELREISFGDWEGMHWSEIERRFSEEAALWMKEYPQRCTPGGENLLEFEARVLNAVNRIAAAATSTVCIVSHGGVMRLLLKHLSRVDDEEAWALTKDYARPIAIDVTEMAFQ
jgi:alpha-ribazole phosphatase